MAAGVNELKEILRKARRDPELLEDPHLNELLQPLRGIGPFRVHCPRCGRTFSWWAIHPTAPRVVFYDKGPRRPGVRRDVIPKSELGPQPPPPFDDWSLGPSDGIDSAVNADPTGGQRRFSFVCECGASYTYTMATMLRMFVEAASSGWKRGLTAR